MPWTPPTPAPVTAEAYATVRLAIDTGCKLVEARAATGKDISSRPTLGDLSEIIYAYIPAEMISMEPAVAFSKKYGTDLEPDPNDPSDRYGWPTFVDRAQLITALEVVTPAAVKAEIGNLDRPPDAKGRELGLLNADIGGSEWWAIALSAAGILAFLGRRSIPGLVASLLPVGPIRNTALWLFRGLLASGAIVGISALLNKTVDNFADAGRNAGDAALGVLFIVIVAAGGYGVVRYANRPSRR